MKITYYLLVLSIFLISCKQDRVKALAGRWELVEAQRAEKPTNTLQGLFFEFHEDRTLKTNLFGVEGEYTYELVDDEQMKIVGTEEDLLFDYKVNKTILNLTTRIEGVRLSLKFSKKERE